MTFTVLDIIEDASISLQDGGSVRYTQPEILSYVNMAVRDIVAKKPTAVTETRVLAMASGPLQTLPADCTVLSRVICNMATISPSSNRQETIRILKDLETVAAVYPNWMEGQHIGPPPGNIVTSNYADLVSYVIYDPINPRQFYVVPGNKGTGFIEAVVGVIPARIAAPLMPLVNASYSALTVDLPDIYQSAVLDFVIYRALAKDSSLPGAKERAMSHKELFNQAINDVISNEVGASVATYVSPRM